MTLEFKIGLLVSTAIIVVGGMSFKVSDSPLFGRGGSPYYALLDDATGLIISSKVKTAGLNVGTVEDIKLENGVARITVRIKGDVPIFTDAIISLKSLGILGDRYVDLNPGNPASGRLNEGDYIKNVTRDKGMDELMDKAAQTMNEVKEIMKAVRAALENEGDRSSTLGRLMLNLEDLSKSLADTMKNNKNNLDNIFTDLAGVMKGLKQNFSSDNKSDDTVIKRLDNILASIDKGEGTVGRLIKDDETVDRMNSALSGIQKFVGKTDRVTTYVDINSAYMADRSDTRSSFGLNLFTSPDKHYELALVSTPEGVISKRVEKQKVNDGATTKTEYETEEKNKLRFNAMFAKRYYDMVFKVGLIESEGGLSMDYFLNHDKIKLTASAFDFGNNKPNLRLESNMRFLRNFYGQVGGDELIENNKRDLYLGAGMTFDDDDIKSLMGLLSFGK